MKRSAPFLVLLAALLVASMASAVEPDEILKDPVLEARARAIGAELRCLVCQNQSIDDSDADLAHDLRLLIRARLKAGDSDTEIERYIVTRYGDYVLLKPPFETKTALLWLGPGLLLMIAFGSSFIFYRRRHTSSEKNL
jgi:cytochrome c-type biogenesis protein CcmH